MITALDLPLNLRGNPHNRFHSVLTAARAGCVAQARALSVVTNPGIGGTSIDRFAPRWYGEDPREISGQIQDATCRLCRMLLSLDETTETSQRLEALLVLSLTLGLRPGELRALTWDHVDLDQGVIHIWHSARRDGDTKTPGSRRSLVLPRRAAEALRDHQKRQAAEQCGAGDTWRQTNLVFCHEDGRPYSRDGLNWRFSKMTRRAGIGHWHAHEGRHTAVSIMSSNGVKIQDISDTVGHKSTHVTETVYRHVIVPAIRGAAAVMDDVFDDTGGEQDGSKTEDS